MSQAHRSPPTPVERFRAALVKMVKEQGRGVQNRLAEELGVSRTFVSSVLNGKKQMGIDRQDQTARYFGFEYEDFLMLGRKVIQEGEDVFPWFNEVQDLELGFDARAQVIIKKAWEQEGVKPDPFDYRNKMVVKVFAKGEVEQYRTEKDDYRFFFNVRQAIERFRAAFC